MVTRMIPTAPRGARTRWKELIVLASTVLLILLAVLAVQQALG